MNSNKKLFSSSIGRKILMALTGLFLCIFLIEHLYGNLLIYMGDHGTAFNNYTEEMTHNLFIRIVEIVLFLSIIIHIIDGLVLTFKNKAARPVGYIVNKNNERTTFFSRTMPITGILILLFLGLHLYSFFLSHRLLHIDGNATMYDAVLDKFGKPWYSAIYFIAMIILGFHLNHGFQSAFKSLGLSNLAYAKLIKKIGTAFAVIITIGFASFPVILYFNLLHLR